MCLYFCHFILTCIPTRFNSVVDSRVLTGEAYGSCDMDGDNIPNGIKYTEIFNWVFANVVDTGIPGKVFLYIETYIFCRICFRYCFLSYSYISYLSLVFSFCLTWNNVKFDLPRLKDYLSVSNHVIISVIVSFPPCISTSMFFWCRNIAVSSANCLKSILGNTNCISFI